ncbi:unnamed protein product [Toxocara canis]|uniref:Usp domain-containing protein n=1 Tax=Toxocara canis TaxID=6265 RepID=A0A183V0V9_TOXCA|nr:unnamed protein product [Toxocara canis]
MLQLEATVDDAWDIAQKINDILEHRSSQVRSLYLHSSGGKKKPAVAAEAIAAVDDDTKKYTTLPRERHLTGARKITRIASTFANAVPTLQRKLSRQQN